MNKTKGIILIVILIAGGALLSQMIKFVIQGFAFRGMSKTRVKKIERQEKFLSRITLFYLTRYNNRTLVIFNLTLYFLFCVGDMILIVACVLYMFEIPLADSMWWDVLETAGAVGVRYAPFISIISLVFLRHK